MNIKRKKNPLLTPTILMKVLLTMHSTLHSTVNFYRLFDINSSLKGMLPGMDQGFRTLHPRLYHQSSSFMLQLPERSDHVTTSRKCSTTHQKKKKIVSPKCVNWAQAWAVTVLGASEFAFWAWPREAADPTDTVIARFAGTVRFPRGKPNPREKT